MQMAVSQTPTAGVQALANGKAAKGADGQAFGLALNQTINGGSGNAGQAAQQLNADTAAAAATTALTNLLGESVTTADLLAAIEGLLKQLDEMGGDNAETNVTEADLNEALAELDNLLALLGAVPALQPFMNQTAVQSGLTNLDANAEADLSLDLDAVKAVMNKASASVENLTAQMQMAAKPEQSGENFAAIKSALEGALTDLRSFLQQGKGNGAVNEQNAIISKQLQAVKLVLGGASLSTAEADVTDAETQVANMLRSMSSRPAASTHLQRLGNQLFHAGLISVIPTQEEAGINLTEEPVPAPTAVLQQAVGSQEVLRQQPVKTVIVQAVPVQQFAETMESLVVKQFNVTSANGMSEARISLYPERLGQVDVRITVHNGQLTAMFVTDTASARDMLESQMAQLRSALQSQGLQVDKLEVSHNLEQSNLFQGREGSSNREQQAAKRNKSEGDSSFDSISFETEDELAIEQAVDRTLGFGRGVNARA
ncbi:flagellar hook-length control protein FliK [Paenibacillus spongiae]|uniref:Flagellar hook-length control protein FliK n=1 Tax=Paenibacillus spongiae TaxID=2909671 RepID=A0ABY5SIJ8_9BACL|nr:flagellar hook-length control protein FliK [Paenibacillus spongiae]UVI32500.1 flagellar hook-length control protein FliK [Paenibacillus spongiae]